MWQHHHRIESIAKTILTTATIAGQRNLKYKQECNGTQIGVPISGKLPKPRCISNLFGKNELLMVSRRAVLAIVLSIMYKRYVRGEPH